MAHDVVRREASRRKVRELEAARSKLVAELRRQRSLLSSEEVAAELGVTLAAVGWYVRAGLLVPVRIRMLGKVRRFFEPQAVVALRKSMGGSPERSRWPDPEYVLKVYWAHRIIEREAERTGFAPEEIEAVFRLRIQSRAKDYRAPGGRPPRSEPPAHHVEWRSGPRKCGSSGTTITGRDSPSSRPPTPTSSSRPSPRPTSCSTASAGTATPTPRRQAALRRDFQEPAIDRVRKARKTPADRAD